MYNWSYENIDILKGKRWWGDIMLGNNVEVVDIDFNFFWMDLEVILVLICYRCNCNYRMSDGGRE